jgi:Spy/CpxP family protein refolding chaperone
MTKQMIIGILVCSAVIFGAMQVYGEDVGPGRWWRQPNVAGDLNLTDRDKQSLDDLFNRNRNQLIDMKADLEKERLKLEDILGKNPVDDAAAKAQFRKVQDMRQKLAAGRFQYILGVRKILGPDRFQRLTGKFQEMRQRRFNEGDQGFRGNDQLGQPHSERNMDNNSFSGKSGWGSGKQGGKGKNN